LPGSCVKSLQGDCGNNRNEPRRLYEGRRFNIREKIIIGMVLWNDGCSCTVMLVLAAIYIYIKYYVVAI